MSWPLLKVVWQHYPPDKSKPVLLALADQARSEDGSSCYPSMTTIAFYAGCKESQARRHVRDLQRRGFVDALTEGMDGGNPHRGRHYRVNIEAIESLPKLDKVLRVTRAIHARGKRSTDPFRR